eukprot:scaffold10996_cov90-Isochrysis_galbana.AAC.2
MAGDRPRHGLRRDNGSHSITSPLVRPTTASSSGPPPPADQCMSWHVTASCSCGSERGVWGVSRNGGWAVGVWTGSGRSPALGPRGTEDERVVHVVHQEARVGWSAPDDVGARLRRTPREGRARRVASRASDGLALRAELIPAAERGLRTGGGPAKKRRNHRPAGWARPTLCPPRTGRQPWPLSGEPASPPPRNCSTFLGSAPAALPRGTLAVSRATPTALPALRRRDLPPVRRRLSFCRSRSGRKLPAQGGCTLPRPSSARCRSPPHLPNSRVLPAHAARRRPAPCPLPRARHPQAAEPAHHAPVVPMPGRPEMLVATDPLVDADEVLDRLKRAVFRSRVRVGDFFSDFDPLRSGLVTEAKFRTALVECARPTAVCHGASRARPTAVCHGASRARPNALPPSSPIPRRWLNPRPAAAPQALAAKYAGPGGRVRHRALLADLESAFTSAGMERDPAANTADFTATLASTGVRLPAEMEAASDELIEQLKHEVRGWVPDGGGSSR